MLRSFLASTLALISFSANGAILQNRITAPIATAQRIPLASTVSPRALQSQDLGLAPTDRSLSVTLRFSMTPAQSAALDQLLLDQQNPASPRYHQWLTPEQFATQFGLSPADQSTVAAWLQSQGLTVTSTARGGTSLTATSSIASVQQAFSTTLHILSLNGEQHIANLTEPSLPAPIAAVVSTITGLDDYRLKPHARAHFTSSISGNHYIAPGDIYTIYDLSPLLATSINGTGVTIAVLGQSDIRLADVAAFRSASGLAANVPTVKLYGTDPGFPSATDLIEAQLDVEWAGAAAPAASILYVNSTDVIAGSLTQAVNNNLAPILTLSYGNCEAGFGSSNIATYNQLLRQANAQGQTLLSASGDTGATDCDYGSTVATNGLAVDFPGSSPYATSVGGTMFNEGTGTYFSATNNANGGSALSYIPEMVWNESVLGAGLAAGGGGASAYFTKPPWQLGIGVPNDFSRDVPDLALNAAANHDPYLFCSSGSCVNGYRNATNNVNVVGGTSVATPIFAGILALVEQKIGTRIGNANPTLYGLANSTYATAVFHDVTTGNNASPCTAGTPNCPTGGSIGYTAATGFDLATGWGSIDAFNLVNDWKLVTPAGAGSTLGANPSATTLTAPVASATNAATVTVTATVASATTGVTAVPTGTIQLLVDGVATTTSGPLVSGTATLTLATTGLTSGRHIITAAYSGDTTYAGSKGVFSIDITSATAPDFSISPSATTATVASGAIASGITFTLTPLNGFTGAVNLVASTTASSLNAQYSFSVTPVTFTSTTPATTVFTLSAFTSSINGGAIPTTGYTKLAGGALAALFLLAIPKRRRRWTALAIPLVAFVATMGLSGCTTSGGSTATGITRTKATPGTYTIIVTATGTNTAGTPLSHSVSLTYTIQ